MLSSYYLPLVRFLVATGPQDMGKRTQIGLIEVKTHFSVVVKVWQNPSWAVPLLQILL